MYKIPPIGKLSASDVVNYRFPKLPNGAAWVGVTFPSATSDLFNKIADWCKEAIGEENYIFLVLYSKIYFRTQEQATSFKLKFGEICRD